jgi:hypothetical protein
MRAVGPNAQLQAKLRRTGQHGGIPALEALAKNGT